MQQRILLCTFFLLFDYLLVHLHVRGAYLETETNDQYQGAIVVFNFTDRHMKVVLGSVAKNSGIYGFHSPIERAAGMIVLPQVDKYGCQPRNYKKSSKYLDWVALVPRGKCSFYTKITNAKIYNASAVITYNYEEFLYPVLMNHKGTGYIVAVSVTYDVGNEVRAMVELHKAVQVYISPGSTIRSGSVRLRNMCTVWIFTIAFNVFRTSI